MLSLQGKKPASHAYYLQETAELLEKRGAPKSAEDWTILKIEEALKVRVCYGLSEVGKELMAMKQDDKTNMEIWND